MIDDKDLNREENITRLTVPKTNINDPYYLTCKTLYADLKDAISRYGAGNVLDVGCGNKPYKSFFSGITSYTGCDIVQSNERLVDIICPATEIPVSDNSMDTVFSTQVIEHVADHRLLLSEAYRILKPGGHLILSGPMAWEHHEVPYDFFRFTRHGFEWLLSRQGFTVLEINPNGGKWVLVGQLTMNAIRSSFQKKTIIRRIMGALFFILRIKWLINLFFMFLDKVDRDNSSTLNFVVVARK